MNISLIIPTRSRPAELRETLRAVHDLAEQPDQVEAVCRLDWDDPQLDDNFKVLREFCQFNYAITGPRRRGYSSVVEFMDECAAVSTGQLILCFNDDMRMETPGWDKVIIQAMADRPRSVGIGEITLNGDASNQYPYSIAVIPRPLYKICGSLGLGYGVDVDRCWGALARHAGCEVKIPFKVAHRQNFSSTPDTNASRDEYSRQLHGNWGARAAEWEAVGKRYAEMIARVP